MSRPHRIASAVVVTRGDERELEVLLVLRAPKLRFFGGYWAFPGGVLDPADHDGDVEEPLARVRCGLRELFEETGLLPPAMTGAWSADDRLGLRRALVEGDEGERWRSALDEHAGALDFLQPCGHLTTPPFAPVRYRTQFLHGVCPADQDPVIEDGELTDGRFFHVGECLDAWARGELLVVPPVLYIFEHLRERALEHTCPPSRSAARRTKPVVCTRFASRPVS